MRPGGLKMYSNSARLIEVSIDLIRSSRISIARCRTVTRVIIGLLLDTQSAIKSTHELIRHTDETIAKYGTLASPIRQTDHCIR
jgi:hypothetical protein